MTPGSTSLDVGLTADALSKKMDDKKRERLRAEAAAAEEEEGEEEEEEEEKGGVEKEQGQTDKHSADELEVASRSEGIGR